MRSHVRELKLNLVEPARRSAPARELGPLKATALQLQNCAHWLIALPRQPTPALARPHARHGLAR